eukprot:TRINITY_DN6000_c0_g2_i1.p1 TRINITY_DN6000_c0_g2~~TRINITY_DN6000_c0_g2_i1.p1  ORF type:complete len:626 (-),score=73.37 TRINITY_DN6000_c0_g2_i1:107-1984(-)
MGLDFRFQVWLHPVHGNSSPVPIERDELALASSMEARLSVLAEVAAASTLQLGAYPEDALRVELRLHGTLLQSRDRIAGTRCVLPLMFSQLSSAVHTSMPASHTSTCRAGVLAIGLPLMTDQGEAASGEECRPCHLWLLVVTCASDRFASIGISRHQAVDVAMREAVTTLMRCGAICDNLCGAQLANAAWERTPLGEGSSAEVRLMRIRFRVEGSQLSEEIPYATKLFNDRYADQDVRVFNEIRHLIKVQGHPNIVNFVGFFRSRVLLASMPRWLMMMEACPSGDLQKVVRARGALSELDAMTFAVGILRALVHVHLLDIIHRDVKLENALLKQDGDAVLVDFGIAVHMSDMDERKRVRGTPGYFAPETLGGRGCVKRSDVFGCGVALYCMLGGVLPFSRSDHESTMRANVRAHVVFGGNHFPNVNEDIKDHIRNMLCRLAKHRLSSRDALERLVQEKDRLAIPPQEGLDVAPLDVAGPVHASIASSSASATAPASAKADILLPGGVQHSSKLDDENAEVQSSILHDDIEGRESIEKSSASTKRTMAFRLVSISSQAFAWARHKISLRRGKRDPYEHAACSCDQTRTQAKKGTESDSKPNAWTSISCESGSNAQAAKSEPSRGLQ